MKSNLAPFTIYNFLVYEYTVLLSTIYKKQGQKERKLRSKFIISQTFFFHNVQQHLFLQSINNINRRKGEFLIKKVIIFDLE